MKTISELRDELALLFSAIRTGELDIARAAEMNNSAGKMINASKVQLEYYALRDEAPNIPFLREESK